MLKFAATRRPHVRTTRIWDICAFCINLKAKNCAIFFKKISQNLLTFGLTYGTIIMSKGTANSLGAENAAKPLKTAS